MYISESRCAIVKIIGIEKERVFGYLKIEGNCHLIRLEKKYV